ncbi:Uncharacterised protein [Klebsiella pneumoniae]|nr:Uncharacterised protein [Klebsiella pneumoniae]SLX75466.1 Uncharacterised protein [Klebsiella pneumoniae]
MPNSIARPSAGWSAAVSRPQPIMAKKTTIPRRKRRRACCGFWVNGEAVDTFCIFTGMRKRGSSVKRAPNQEPMAVAMANSQACRENCGMPVKKAARLQPIASRAPNPAMMPPATACAMRIRLRGKRSLTLFAHSAAARQPPNMPMIILPSMRVSGDPSRCISW